MAVQLLRFTAHDGSRHFLATPANCSHGRLRRRAEALPGAAVTEFLDVSSEVWLDFTFRGHQFTINDQLGEHWFFVADPRCPEEILIAVAEHFTSAD